MNIQFLVVGYSERISNFELWSWVFFFFLGLSILFLNLFINLFVVIIFGGYIEVGSLEISVKSWEVNKELLYCFPM